MAKWQVISFLSRGLAVFLGLVQSFVIIRILTQAEWGLVQLAASIGGALGIYQHLGLASASTREISAAKDKGEIFKIFVTSAFIRYCITFPLAIGLFFFAHYISNTVYKHPELVLPLRVYAITLLFQGMQSILNSVISGTKRFKRLFIYQVSISLIALFIYIPLVYLYRINGYFYALLVFTATGTAILGFLALKPLVGSIRFPSRKEFLVFFKEIFSISIAIYLVKILYTNWEKLGTNVLGLFNTAEVIAIFSFAVLYAKKILHISDSVTDINLPVLSEKYVTDISDFKRVFTGNFNKVFIFITSSAAIACFWAPQIILIAVGKQKFIDYYDSLSIIPPLLLAFVVYSLMDIVKSSIFIPAKLSKDMVFGFVLLVLGTGGFFFATYKVLGVLFAMSWGTAFGAVVGLAYMIIISRKKLGFEFFNKDHFLLLIQSFFIGICGLVESVWVKIPVFVVLLAFLIWGIHSSGFVTKAEIVELGAKIKSRFGVFSRT